MTIYIKSIFVFTLLNANDKQQTMMSWNNNARDILWRNVVYVALC